MITNMVLSLFFWCLGWCLGCWWGERTSKLLQNRKLTGPARCGWFRHRWGIWEIIKQNGILGGEATHQRKVCQDCGKAKQRSVWSEG